MTCSHNPAWALATANSHGKPRVTSCTNDGPESTAAGSCGPNTCCTIWYGSKPACSSKPLHSQTMFGCRIRLQLLGEVTQSSHRRGDDQQRFAIGRCSVSRQIPDGLFEIGAEQKIVRQRKARQIRDILALRIGGGHGLPISLPPQSYPMPLRQRNRQRGAQAPAPSTVMLISGTRRSDNTGGYSLFYFRVCARQPLTSGHIRKFKDNLKMVPGILNRPRPRLP